MGTREVLGDPRSTCDERWRLGKEKGVKCFNLYLPPTIRLGDADKAGPWVDHVRKVSASEADHLFNEPRNECSTPTSRSITLAGGAMGIGKDTLLEAVKQAVGSWNFEEVSPIAVMGRFDKYAKSVILRVSEIRDQGDIDRYAFYEPPQNSDGLAAGRPPRRREAYQGILRTQLHGIMLTTNYKTDSICLRADDRRHFVASSRPRKN